LPGKFTQRILFQITNLVGGNEAIPVPLNARAETTFDQLSTLVLDRGRKEGRKEGREGGRERLRKVTLSIKCSRVLIEKKKERRKRGREEGQEGRKRGLTLLP